MNHNLVFLFHPRSIAIAGISLANPEHWTRTFLESLLEFQFSGPIYPVNPRGGEVRGLKVFPSLDDIPQSVDYVISTVPAIAAPGLVDECTHREVKAIHFCTAGFSETGEEEGARLEAELTQMSQNTGIRIIGPNCMGIYCPQSRLSFNVDFPKEGGSVAFVSQSGGNAGQLVRQAMKRGVRFSKVISYGNACDLNESDFLEYLAADADTKIIALYVEGVKDGKRFRQTLRKAANKKPVVLLKGGVTQGGTRAVAGHTGSLAGSEATWHSLCKQLRIIQVHSLEELADMLVTLLFMPFPRGRNVALVGFGGGASVLITDDFEKRGLKVPPLSQETRNRIREFTPVAGNILGNPIDYSQVMETKKIVKLMGIVSEWEEIDILIGFLRAGQGATDAWAPMFQQRVGEMLEASEAASKPLAVVLQTGISPEEVKETYAVTQKSVALGVPVYYSFADAAHSLNLYLSHKESKLRDRKARSFSQ